VGVHHGGADSCSSAHAMNTSSSPQWRHPLTGVRTDRACSRRQCVFAAAMEAPPHGGAD